MADKKPNIKVIDLFCWIGGITRWFIDEDLNVVAGIDFEGSCKFGYEANNKWAQFIHKDIREVKTEEIEWLYGEDCDMKILVWCAPCQPFSAHTNKSREEQSGKNRWRLLDSFGGLVEEVKPDFVSMENVTNLQNQDVFRTFVATLERAGYFVRPNIVYCPDYGIPQKRKRLILLASKFA